MSRVRIVVPRAHQSPGRLLAQLHDLILQRRDAHNTARYDTVLLIRPDLSGELRNSANINNPPVLTFTSLEHGIEVVNASIAELRTR